MNKHSKLFLICPPFVIDKISFLASSLVILPLFIISFNISCLLSIYSLKFGVSKLYLLQY